MSETNKSDQKQFEEELKKEKEFEKKRIQEDRTIRNSQNKEYEESLAKDLIKKAEREKAREAEARKAERLKKIQEYRERIKGAHFDGPVKVLCRFPDGKRQIIGLANNKCSIDELFNAIISHPSCPNYFFVRQIRPNLEIKCYPDWYLQLIKEEEPETANGLEESKNEREIELVSNSIIFVNTRHK
ncbi:unnamed protein product [Caenorhabditis angaria]|uniref:UBX domain-containing protein n=1 Tax=Caenorhabditis angaria TaxID=860376 RepID=A0A9P1MWM1_9PELO|nr:unnamed protein product [Caenorhabditis angaria]